MSSTRYSCHILMKLEFSREILQKNTQVTNLNDDPSSERRVVPCGGTDRQT